MAKIQMRRGLRADWVASSVILAAGEIGYAIDTGDIRLGDGVNTWVNLKEPATTALSTKAPLNSPIFTGTPTVPDNTWTISDTQGLQTALDAKADATHSHAQSDVTGLTTALSGKESTITAGTTAQYWRGDKSWQTLDKTAVGLSNVNNTSDSNKPISIAALDVFNTIFSGFTPPSGAWLQPANLMNTTTGTPTVGTVYLSPFDIGPGDLSIQSIGAHVTTAQAGGTTTTTIGLYLDDGTGGAPLLSTGGLLASNTILPTSIGRKTISTSLTLPRGRYWSAFLHTESVAPTTAAVYNVITNAAPALWIADSATIGSVGRALQIASQSALPTTSQTITSVTSGNVAPSLALRVL